MFTLVFHISVPTYVSSEILNTRVEFFGNDCKLRNINYVIKKEILSCGKVVLLVTLIGENVANLAVVAHDFILYITG